MKRARIILIRHGQTVANKEGRFCGHSETSLTDLGRAQALALCARLAPIRLHAAYASDFSRAIDTAALILEGRALSVSIDPDLRELHYGDWEQLRERDVARTKHWRDEFARMRAEDPAWRPPGGETIAEVQARTFAALTRIARRHPGEAVLVVTHGSAINCMLAAVLGMPPDLTFRITVANCALNELLYSRERFVVERVNDTSHLPAPGARA